jgi:hypothetical protein
MQIEQISTAELIPYARNSRTHNDEQIAQIAASIREFGFTNPVLIDDDNGIIAGHGRVMAATRLKLDTVPCIRLSHLSDTQKRAYIIADNKLALNSGWDDELLKLELQELQELDFNIDLLGFDVPELDSLLDELADNNDASKDNPYTTKVSSPVYQPTGDKPSESELYDFEKAQSLIDQINYAELPLEIKKFLTLAAYRHVRFDFSKIAEYYCHAPKEVQELMEDSALVIIDFNKALELGYVKLNEELSEIYSSEYPDAE